MESTGPSHAGAAPPPAAGVALFRLIRHWARRAPQNSAKKTTGSAKNVSRILVIDAVAAAAEHSATVDVTAIAVALGVDHSVASRMVRDASLDGLITRNIATHDSRHASLVLTQAGQRLVDAARQWQNSVFEQFTADWSAQERETFGRMLIRFCDAATSE